MRASVDLPEPFAPTMPMRCSRRLSETSSTTASASKRWLTCSKTISFMLHAHRDALAAADRARCESGSVVVGGEHACGESDEQYGTGCPPRMSERDGTAVGGDEPLVEGELVADGEELRGERLGDLDEPELRRRQARSGEGAACGGCGPQARECRVA